MKTYVSFTRFQTLVYYFASFIGLAPFSVRNNILHPAGFPRKAYATILGILSSLWMYLVFLNKRAQGIEVSYVNQFVFDIVVFIFAMNLWVSLLVYAFKSNEIIDIWNRITAIKDELKTSRIEDESGKNWINFYAKIIAMNGVVLLLRKMIDSANHDYHHDRGTIFVAQYWIGYIMTSIHSHSAILIFVETINCIRDLFESLNNRLQGRVKPKYNSFPFGAQQNSSALTADRNRRIADQGAHGITTESETIQLSVEDIQKIGELHRELCDLVDSATNIHTVPILFTIIRHFSNSLSNWYSMYTHVFVTHDVVFSLAQRLIPRTAMGILELLLIAHACTSMSRAGNATKALVHEVWNKFHPEELREELSMLSLQLLHKPITVFAFGFFDLGYSYLYKIFYAFIAYFIIMIQFDASQQSSRPQDA